VGVITDVKEIYAIGHRVVHAGERFNGTVMINDAVMAALKECIPLAPLHNPPNIMGIEATASILPGIPMACTFDTAFHLTMPPEAYIYPIPYQYYRKYHIRRYGFHGTSHFFVAKEAAKKMGRPLKDLKVITCHLGNGASITAIRNGESIDTSMGFTPLQGLVMGTRCGDIDPAIPLFLQKKENLSADEVDAILNKRSGMQGISEISSDNRDVWLRANEGDENARLAIDIMAYRLKKYIGSYIAALNGVDVIVMTAGVGENDTELRRLALSNLESLGIQLDEEVNSRVKASFGVISKAGSPVSVMVVPTNEELEIAEQTLQVVNGQKD
jgi:acetate kinase